MHYICICQNCFYRTHQYCWIWCIWLYLQDWWRDNVSNIFIFSFIYCWHEINVEVPTCKIKTTVIILCKTHLHQNFTQFSCLIMVIRYYIERHILKLNRYQWNNYMISIMMRWYIIRMITRNLSIFRFSFLFSANKHPHDISNWASSKNEMVTKDKNPVQEHISLSLSKNNQLDIYACKHVDLLIQCK